jgi:hypothetical protein
MKQFLHYHIEGECDTQTSHFCTRLLEMLLLKTLLNNETVTYVAVPSCISAECRCQFSYCIMHMKGYTVAQWLRHCATNWKVTGSIPNGVAGFF